MFSRALVLRDREVQKTTATLDLSICKANVTTSANIVTCRGQVRRKISDATSSRARVGLFVADFTPNESMEQWFWAGAGSVAFH